MIRQARAIKSIDLIAFASISLAPSNLDEDSKAPAGRPVDDVVGHPISGRPCGLTEGVVGFPTSHHSPPTQRNSRRNGRQSGGYSHGWWLEIRRATTTKRRAQNKALAHHQARGLNPRHRTNQEAYDAPWFGAQGSNAGPGLAIPRGAPLWHSHSCYELRKIVRIYTDLTTNLFIPQLFLLFLLNSSF